MTALLAPLARLGRTVLAALASVGRVALYALSAFSHIFRPPYYPRELFNAKQRRILDTLLNEAVIHSLLPSHVSIRRHTSG